MKNSLYEWNFKINTSIWDKEKYYLKWDEAFIEVMYNNNSFGIMVFDYNDSNIFAYVLKRIGNKVYIRERLFNSEINKKDFYFIQKGENEKVSDIWEENRKLTIKEVQEMKKDGIIFDNSKNEFLFSEFVVDIEDIKNFFGFNKYENRIK